MLRLAEAAILLAGTLVLRLVALHADNFAFHPLLRPPVLEGRPPATIRQSYIHDKHLAICIISSCYVPQAEIPQPMGSKTQRCLDFELRPASLTLQNAHASFESLPQKTRNC
jgi:hypothetical protein